MNRKPLFLTALFCIVAAVQYSSCRQEGEPPLQELDHLNREIIGGEPSGPDDFPATGAVLVQGQNDQGSRRRYLCSGVLIAPDTVLTAAHCITSAQQMNEQSFTFSTAEDVTPFFDGSGTTPPSSYRVVATVPHPDYELDTGETGLQDSNDIGLLYLDQRAEVPHAYVMQPGNPLEEGRTVYIAGYGETSAESGAAAGVRYDARTILNRLGDTEMQIGTAGNPRSCFGDSGGPTYSAYEDGKQPQLRVIGVSSHTFAGDDCLLGGVDTRVDVHRGWLQEQMTAACNQGTRVACAPGEVFPVPLAEQAGEDAGPDGGVDGGSVPPPAGGGSEEEDDGCRTVPGREGPPHTLLLLVLLLPVVQGRSRPGPRRPGAAS